MLPVAKCAMAFNPKQANYLLQQLQVLVVDDSSFMRTTVRNLLYNIGVKSVIEAANGIAGLDRIRDDKPNIVILDWEMPLLNGAELVRIVLAGPDPEVNGTYSMPSAARARCGMWSWLAAKAAVTAAGIVIGVQVAPPLVDL